MNSLWHSKSGVRAIAAAAVVAALGSGCSGAVNTAETAGFARIAIAGRNLSAANVSLTISPGTQGSQFTPITENLTQSGGNWTAYVTGIPIGNGRQFDVKGTDSSGNTLFTGTGHADITAGGVATVVIAINSGTGGPPVNTSAPVISYISASATLVAPSGTVRLGASATDPSDPNATITYSWTAVCGTFDAHTGSAVTWTAPSAVPSTPGGGCQISLTVANTHTGSSVTASIVVSVGVFTGDVLVTVTGSAGGGPVITGMTAKVTYGSTVEGDIGVTETDSTGGTLTYAWSSNCSSTLTITTTGQYSPSAPHFSNTDLKKACVVTLTLSDSQGGQVMGAITVPPAPAFQPGPTITNTTQPSVDQADGMEVVSPGDAVMLTAEATGPQGHALQFAWAHTAGTVDGQVDSTKAPWKSVAVYHVPSPLAATMQVTVTVTDAVTNEYATHVFKFKGASAANPCANKADGTACDDGNACTTGDVCTGGVCKGTAVTCAASDQCHGAGACDPTSGQCSNPPLANGSPCNDGNACTTDACGNGACVGTPIACTASDQCHSAGTCDPASGQCSNPAKADGMACNDGNACTQSDTCQSGVCTGSNPVSCPGGTCNPSTGTCSGGATPAALSGVLKPSTSTAAVGQVFTASLAVTNTGGTAANGVKPVAIPSCTGATPAAVAVPAGSTASFLFTNCSGSQAGPLTLTTSASGTDATTSAAVTTGTVNATVTVSAASTASIVVPQVARDLQISGPPGLAMDLAGNTYVAASIYSTTPISFDGHSVASGGDADIFLAKYDTTGTAVWAVGYGDGASANPQIATGAAVANDGTLAVIGSFSGTFSIGTTNLSSSSPIDLLGFFKQSDGTGLSAKQFNDGVNGALKSVAANPNDSSAAHGNRVAVCGLANQGTPALPPSGAVAATGNDIIIGVFKTDGSQLWGSQFSSAGTFNEECDSVALDDNGDVWAIGSTSGASLNFGGATSALTGPGNSNKKYLWIAKFNGATGAAIYSAIFTGTGQVTPNSTGGNSIVVDLSGNVIASGQVVGAVTFGSTTLTSAGAADAWVARFGPTLTPIWAERLGGTKSDNVNGVSVDAAGDVIATGAFNVTATIGGTTASSSTITANGTTAPDVFVWKLNGTTGATDFVAGYGDAATQTGDAIAANKYGANQITFAGTLNASIPFPAPAGTVTATGSTDVFLTTAKLQ